MIIFLAIGLLIFVLLFHLMLKETGIADTMFFCDFANGPPSGLKTVLLRFIIIFRKYISRMKLQNDGTKFVLHLQLLEKFIRFTVCVSFLSGILSPAERHLRYCFVVVCSSVSPSVRTNLCSYGTNITDSFSEY